MWQKSALVQTLKQQTLNFPKLGYHFGGPHNKEYNIFGPCIRVALFWETVRSRTVANAAGRRFVNFQLLAGGVVQVPEATLSVSKGYIGILEKKMETLGPFKRIYRVI